MSDVDVIIQVHTQGVQQIGNLSASLRNLSNTLRGINVPMSKLDSHTRAVNKALGITSRGVDQHAKSIKQLVQNQKVLALESRKLKSDIGNLKNAYALAGGETTALGRSIGVTTKELQAFSRTFKGMRIRAIGSDFHNVSLRMSKLGKDAQFVGRSLLINLTLPLATFARVGLQSFRAVDQEMTRLIKVSENLASSLDIAYQKMGVFGAATAEQKVRAEEMVEAFNRVDYRLTTMSLSFGVAKEMVTSIAADFAELGITAVENTEKLTLMTLQIEKLGNMDVGPAQDLATALYFQSRRALEVNGALAKLTTAREREAAAISAAKAQMLLFNSVENATALTLRDLGDAFPEVASAATSFGLSMTEAAAMLAPMKAAGLDVGASANSIKVSLQRLLAPTKQNTEMLNKLAQRYGVANEAQNEFTLSTKTGLIGLDATVRMFDRVRSSSAGMEGALRLMSDLFEKRQGPRMYLAIEQLADFNRELQKTEQFANKTLPATASAEIQMARVADEAARKFSFFNTNITPDTIRSFKDIGNVARIATAQAGQKIQIEPGKEVIIKDSDIQQAKAMRKAVSDLILQKRQAEGIDLISEAKTETGRAMLIELAGAANAQAIAQQELDRSLETVGVQIDKIKIAFKQFAAEIIKKLKPAIEDLSERVVKFLKHWSSPEMKEAREKIINMILSLGGFLATMGPIILALGTFQSVVGNVGKGLSVFFPKLKNVQGEFIGIGRSAKLAAKSIDAFYTSFLDKAKSAPLVPTPGSGSGISRPAKPFNRQKVIDKVVKDELAKTGATPAEIRKARQELRAGTSGRLTPKGTLVRGTRGRTLSTGTSAALKVLEAAGEEGTRLSGVSGMATDPEFRRVYKRTRRTIDRARDISKISPYLEAAGVSTDEMGTKFVRRGREITEGQARGLGRGGISAVRARVGIAGAQAKGAITGLATAPVKGFTTALNNARAAQAALIAQQAAFGATPGRFRLMASGVMNFVKSLKIARMAAVAFRAALLFTGIGAIIAGIAAVVYLVIKNMDKIKNSTKAWNKLKVAFDIIKNAALEIVRPIQDLFAAFGGGGDDAEAAGNGIAKAFEGISAAVLFVAKMFKWLVKKVIQPYLYGIVNIVMAVISLFKGNWQDALKFLIAAFASVIKGIVNLFIGMAKGLVKIVVGIVNGILNIFSKIPGMGGIVKGIQGAVSKVGDTIVGMYDAVGKGITGLLDKGVDLGIKKSSNSLKSKGKPKFEEAGTEIGEAGNEAITSALGNEEGVEDAAGKLANAIKEGVKDAAQQLYDFVVDRLGDSIKKFVSNTVKALQKQKESALKVFDVQINTLMKLEKAEESLTRKKEYETNRRKLIDDATLRGEAYRRNRALAIYEGRIDDARILDLEEQQAAKESTQELATLDESRRKDLAKENLEALREAINSAKDLAGKFFDESLEKFQEAADHITRIAPVTIEQYTAQLAELQTLTTQAADTNNLEFGKMFEKFSTTIAEQMPNAVDDFGNAIGAFTEPLDKLVTLAMEKYGLGSENEATVLGVTREMANSVIGITLGMLVDMGDTFEEQSSTIAEQFGDITGGITGDIGTFKTEALANFATMLEQVKLTFIAPFKKALDEADPATVFKNAIVDGNETILNSFRKLVALNPDLMKQMADSLDPAIKKYIALKAAADAAADAAANAGGGSGSGTSGSMLPEGFTTADRYEDWLRRNGLLSKSTAPSAIINIRSSAARTANLRRLEAKGYKEGGPVADAAMLRSTPYGVSGFLNAPEQQGIPAILHGGEFVINADAVKRIGLGALAKLNDPRIPKFKKGGLVGAADQAERKALTAAKSAMKTTIPYTADGMERIIKSADVAYNKHLKNAQLGYTADTLDKLITPPSLNLKKQPIIQNKDGSVSTVLSIGADIGKGRVIVVPTVDRRTKSIVDDNTAINNAFISGEHLGIYPNARIANLAAQAIHKNEEKRILPKIDPLYKRKAEAVDLLLATPKIAKAKEIQSIVKLDQLQANALKNREPQPLDKRSGMQKFIDGVVNIGGQGGLLDRGTSFAISATEDMIKSITDTAYRVPSSLWNVASAFTTDVVKNIPKEGIGALGLESIEKNITTRQNQLYGQNIVLPKYIPALGGTQLTKSTGTSAIINDAMNVIPIGAFGKIGQLAGKAGLRFATSEFALSMLGSYSGPGANLINSLILGSSKLGQVGGTHYALHGAERLAAVKGVANKVKQFGIDKIVGVQDVFSAGYDNAIGKIAQTRIGKSLLNIDPADIIANRVERGLVGGNINLDRTYAKSMYDKFGERIISRGSLGTGAAKDLSENPGLRNVLFTGTRRARRYVEQNNLPDYLAELFTTSELKQVNSVLKNIKGGNSEMIRSYWSNILTRSYSPDSDIAMFLAAADAEKMIGFSYAKDGSINFGDSLAIAKLRLFSPLGGEVADATHKAAIDKALEEVVKTIPGYATLLDEFYPANTRPFASGTLNLNPAGVAYTPTTVNRTRFGLNFERYFDRAKTKVSKAPPDLFATDVETTMRSLTDAVYVNSGYNIKIPTHIPNYEPKQLAAVFESEYVRAYKSMLGLDKDRLSGIQDYGLLDGIFGGSVYGPFKYETPRARHLIGRTLMDLPEELKTRIDPDLLFSNADEALSFFQAEIAAGVGSEEIQTAMNNQINNIISSFYDSYGQVTPYGQQKIKELTQYFEFISARFEDPSVNTSVNLQDYMASIFGGGWQTEQGFNRISRYGAPVRGLDAATVDAQSFSIFGALSGNNPQSVGIPITAPAGVERLFGGLNSIEADTVFKIITGDPQLWKNMPNGGIARQRYLTSATVVQELLAGRATRNNLTTMWGNKPLYDIADLDITTSLLGGFGNADAASEGLRAALHSQFYPMGEYGRYSLDYAMKLYESIEKLGNPSDILNALQTDNFFLPFLGDSYYQALSEQYNQFLKKATESYVLSPDGALGALLYETSRINDVYREFFNPNITDRELDLMMRSLTQMDSDIALLSNNVQIPNRGGNVRGARRELIANMPNLSGRLYAIERLSANPSRIHEAFPYVQDFDQVNRDFLISLGSLDKLPFLGRRNTLPTVTEYFDPGLPIRGINSADAMPYLTNILEPRMTNLRMHPIHSAISLEGTPALQVDFPELLRSLDGALGPTFTQYTGHGRQLYSEFSNALAELMPLIINEPTTWIMGNRAIGNITIPRGASRYYDNLQPVAQDLIRELINNHVISRSNIVDLLVPDVAPERIGYSGLSGMTGQIPLYGGYSDTAFPTAFPSYPRLEPYQSYPSVPRVERSMSTGIEPFIDQPYGHFLTYGGRGQPLFEGLPAALKSELQEEFYRKLNTHILRARNTLAGNIDYSHINLEDLVQNYIVSKTWWGDIDSNLKARVIDSVYQSGGYSQRSFVPYEGSPIDSLRPSLIESANDNDSSIAGILTDAAMDGSLFGGRNVGARFQGFGYRGSTSFGRGDEFYLNSLSLDEAMRVLYAFGQGVYPPVGIPSFTPEGELIARMPAFRTEMANFIPDSATVRRIVPEFFPPSADLIPGFPDYLERIGLSIPQTDVNPIGVDETLNRLRFAIVDRRGIYTTPVDYSIIPNIYREPIRTATARPTIAFPTPTPPPSIVGNDLINVESLVRQIQRSHTFGTPDSSMLTTATKNLPKVGDAAYRDLQFETTNRDVMDLIVSEIFTNRDTPGSEAAALHQRIINAIYSDNIIAFQDIMGDIESGIGSKLMALSRYSDLIDREGYGSLDAAAAHQILRDIIENPEELFALLKNRAGFGKKGPVSLTSVPNMTGYQQILRAIVQDDPSIAAGYDNIMGEINTFRYNPIYGHQPETSQVDIANLQRIIQGSSSGTTYALPKIQEALNYFAYPGAPLTPYSIQGRVAGGGIDLPFIGTRGISPFSGSERLQQQKIYEGMINVIQNAIISMSNTKDGAALMKAVIQGYDKPVDQLFIPTLASSMDTLLGLKALSVVGNPVDAASLTATQQVAEAVFGHTIKDSALRDSFVELLNAQLSKSRLFTIGGLSGFRSTPTVSERIFMDSLIEVIRKTPSQTESLANLPMSNPSSFSMVMGMSAAQAHLSGFERQWTYNLPVGYDNYYGSGLLKGSSLEAVFPKFQFEGRTGAEVLANLFSSTIHHGKEGEALNNLKMFYQMYRDYLSAGKDVNTFLGRADDARDALAHGATNLPVFPFAIEYGGGGGSGLPIQLQQMFELFESAEKIAYGNSNIGNKNVPLMSKIHTSYMDDLSVAASSLFAFKTHILPYLDAIDVIGATSSQISHYAQRMSQSLGLPIIPFGNTGINPYIHHMGDIRSISSFGAGRLNTNDLSPAEIMEFNFLKELKDKLSEENAKNMSLPIAARTSVGLSGKELNDYYINIVDNISGDVRATEILPAIALAAAGIGVGAATFFSQDGQASALGNNGILSQNYLSPDRFEERVRNYYLNLNNLKELIASGESINAADPYSAWAKPGAPGLIMPSMTSMKIGEIINASGGHAVGKYQNMPQYLLERAKVAGYNIGTIFTPEVQEAIMLSTLMSTPQYGGTGLSSYFNNKISTDTAVNRIANMWRSMSGTGGEFVGGGTNPTGFDSSRRDLIVRNLLEKMKFYYPGFKKGGYVKGAMSQAIPATLHGGEYVLNAKAVNKIGIPALNAINANKPKPPIVPPSKEVQRYDEQQRQKNKENWPRGPRPIIPMPKPPQGGWGPATGPGISGDPRWNARIPVPAMPSNNFRFAPPTSTINPVQAPVTNNVSTVNIQVENFIGQEEWFNSMMKEYNVNVLPKNQKLAGLEQRKFTSYNGINQGM